MKNSSSKNSSSSSRSELPHSPLQAGASPLSEHGDPQRTPYHSPQESLDQPIDNSKALVPFEKPNQYPPAVAPSDRRKMPESVQPAMTVHRVTREDPPPSVTKVGPAWTGDVNRGRSRTTTVPSPWSRSDDKLRRAALGFRFSEVVLCLISFSVMAADKTQGWSGDSFDRYKEYRYCLSVNVIAFAYAFFQAFDLAYQITTGKHVIGHHHRYHFDFFMDQVLAYLLISASSSAATRVDDWQSNWGKDEFTEMASASVGMAFLAFIAFAFSSLISGYNLCTRSSTATSF